MVSNDARKILHDIGELEHNLDARPRPYPYDPSIVLTVTSGVGADTFGGYTQLIPSGTYDFGDSPNRLRVVGLNIELMSANDTYVMEFYGYDGSTYTPIGAIRFRRKAVVPRTFIIPAPCREYNCDDEDLYARLKSASGSNKVTFSLSVVRHIRMAYYQPNSTGTWPTG